VTVAELDLELHAAEERGRRIEDEPVAAGLEVLGEPEAAVRVGRAASDGLVAATELDGHAARRLAAAGVEDVRGE
jgi:hypothetical protein